MATELASSTLYSDNIPKEIGGSTLDVSTLKALYKFNTGALTTDSSGEGHTLTAISDPAEGTGVFGTCADFDDNDAYSATDHADFKPTGVFSASAWIKTSDTAGDKWIMQSWSANTAFAGWYFRISDEDTVRFVIGRNNAANVAGTDYKALDGVKTITDNVWHHIVVVYDQSNMYIYIDGKLDNSVAWSTNAAYAATNYVRVGCYNATGSNTLFYTGSLDDVGFWNGKALSATEVSDIYGRLSAYYRFSTGALTTDSSHWNTLTAISDPAEVDGVFGKGADFDGDDAYSAVDKSELKPTGAFSFSGWVKGTGASMNIAQSISINTNYAGWQIGVGSTNNFTFLIGKNTGTTADTDYKVLTATKAINDGSWHFIVCTWDTSDMYIYIDGVFDNSVAWANAPAYAATNYVRFGCRNNTGSDNRFWTGQVDDFAFWNGKALTADEVGDLYGILKILKARYRGLMGVGL